MIGDMKSTVKSVIEMVIRNELGNAKIVDVRVDEDTDFDGDEVYRVTVIFDGSSSSLDPKKISGLARHIRTELEENMYRFPMLSFISRSDARKIGIAAA